MSASWLLTNDESPMTPMFTKTPKAFPWNVMIAVYFYRSSYGGVLLWII